MTTRISQANIQTATLAALDGPTITNIQVTDSGYTVLDDTAVSLTGGYIRITGTNFSAGCTVTIGSFSATSVAFVSSTTLNVQVPAAAAGTYVVYVINSDGAVAIRVNGITYSSEPTWVTASTLTGDSGTAVSIQLSATGASSYTLQAGSTLPANLTLSSSGLISGTVTIANETLYNFTVIATDAELQDSPRAFTITITVGDPLFAQTTLLLPGSATTFVRDASTNNFAVTVFGDARPNTFNPYLTGWSNSFTGSSDFLTLPSSSSAYNFGSSVDFTIEAWVYPTLLAGFSWGIIDARVSGATSAAWIVHLVPSGGTYRLEFFNAGANTGTAVIPLNVWTHIAVVRNGTALRTYVNGVLDLNSASYGTGAISPGTTAPRIGPTKDASGTNYTTVGNISNLRIVNGTAIYTANFTPPTAPLTAISGTSLLTCQSNRFRDLSTNNFAVTATGSAAADSFSPFLEPATTNGSGFFDGAGDYLSVPDNAAFSIGTNNFTFECWVYPTSITAGNNNVLAQWGNGNAWIFRYIAAGRPQFTGAATNVTGTTTAVVVNQWNHLAITRTSNTVRLFVNGVQDATTGTIGALTEGSSQVTVAAYSDGTSEYVTGYLSNVRLVNGTSLYTANFTPPTAPLTAVTNTSLLTLQNNQPHNNHQFLDSSTENFLITRSGNPTQGTFSPYSPSGWSNFFDGTGDFLTVGSSTNLALGAGNWTVEAWIHPTSVAISQNIIIDWRSSNDGLPVLYMVNNQVWWRESSATRITSSATLNANTWYHVAVVKVSTTTTMYINGVSVGSYTDTTNYSNSDLKIGKAWDSNHWNGYISNLRIVRGTAVYTAAFTPPTQPLTAIAGTSLLTCADNRFIDDSVNNFAITRNGEVRATNFSPFRAVAQTPITYSAFFDGNGDTLTTPSSSAFNISGNFTIEGWYNFTALPPSGQNDNLWTFSGATTFNPYLYLWGDGTLILRTAQTSGTVFTATHNFALGVWYHIAVVKSGTSFTLYINGTSAATGTSSGIASENKSLLIGEGSTFGLQGYLSNFRVVNGQALYTSNFTPSTTPLTTTSQGATAGNVSLLTCQSATFVDNSPNRFALTIAGNSQPTMVNPFGSTFTPSNGYTAADHGGSVYFDGTGDYLSSPGSVSFQFPGDFTIEGWMYFTNTGGASPQALFSVKSGATEFDIRWFTNRWQVSLNAGSGTDIGATPAPVNNAWTHVACVRSGSSINLYVNGIRTATTLTNSSTLGQAASAASIGASNNGGNIFTGYISNVRVIKGTALYTSSFVPPLAPVQPTNNTVLLVNGTGAAIADATTKNVVETVGNAQISTAVSRTGGSSMSFDGSGDRLIILDNPVINLGSGDFTLECWAYFNVVNAEMTIISKGWQSSSAFASYLIYMTSGASLRFLASSSGGAWEIANERVIGTATAGTWTHIAVTRSGTTFRAFVNGVINNSFTFTSSAALANIATQTLFIGSANNGNSQLNGYIQDLRITTGAARYTATFTPPAAAFQTK